MKRNITIFFTLLLLGGMMNDAWAKKVTYHILTKPFTVKTWNGAANFHTNVRVEALQCTSEESTVGLPAQFVSPLATGFRYWGGIAESTYGKLYDSGHGTKIIGTQYDLYDCNIHAHRGQERCVTDQNSTSHGDRHAVRFRTMVGRCKK